MPAQVLTRRRERGLEAAVKARNLLEGAGDSSQHDWNRMECWADRFQHLVEDSTLRGTMRSRLNRDCLPRRAFLPYHERGNRVGFLLAIQDCLKGFILRFPIYASYYSYPRIVLDHILPTRWHGFILESGAQQACVSGFACRADALDSAAES